MASSIESLPTEALDAVCGYLASQRDLLAVTRTSQLLAAVAQRFLYREMVITSDQKHAVATLAGCPRLARHVRNFTIIGPLDNGGAALFGFLRLLGRALSNMSRATSLRLFLRLTDTFSPSLISSASRAIFAPSTTLASHTTFPQLTTFACDLNIDEHLAQFLAHCPSVEQLQFGNSMARPTPPSAFPFTSLPKLNTLVAPSHGVRLLAPGRPVRAIEISPSPWDDSGLAIETLDAISQSSVPLLALDVATPSFDVQSLEFVADAVGTHLCSLRVTVLDALEHFPETNFFAPIADVLDTFPNLWSFELSGFHWSSRLAADKRRAWQREPLQPPPLNVDPWLETQGDAIIADDWGIGVLY
ncbi:hypothetical protein BKA62DRAFT_813780 [Auriculariales sp. MPI-PUGE-AT-0066]|nr:hypothetical protein BKA62DRAFT_813780 [Auriculariales sp. MPI-PUGE-AT-0066]